MDTPSGGESRTDSIKDRADGVVLPLSEHGLKGLEAFRYLIGLCWIAGKELLIDEQLLLVHSYPPGSN